MNIFFDTTVLVAASAHGHPHHSQALPALQRVIAKQDKGAISLHSIAETYAALTRLPVVPRIHPSEAVRIVTDNILAHFKAIPLEKSDYEQAMVTVSDGGWSGARIYDALILQCAAKAKADRIYTFNLFDFRSVAPPNLQNKICSP
jgi:predicted nucleic acid-binding protein